MAQQAEPAARIAVVTGGTRGIGRAIVDRLAATGMTVIASGVQRETVDKLNAEAAARGLAISALVCDIADETSVAALFDEVEARHGKLDVLVANAGISLKLNGRRPLVVETTTEFWTRTVGVNLTGTFFTCRAAVPLLQKAGGGRVVLIGSQAGRVYTGFSSAAYGASKAGLIGLNRVLAGELGPSGITVNLVAPTRTATDMSLMFASPAETERQYVERTPLGRVAQPDDVAGAVAYLVSPDAGFVTGTIIDVTGGFYMP